MRDWLEGFAAPFVLAALGSSFLWYSIRNTGQPDAIVIGVLWFIAAELAVISYRLKK